jgi:hypothetical protein
MSYYTFRICSMHSSNGLRLALFVLSLRMYRMSFLNMIFIFMLFYFLGLVGTAVDFLLLSSICSPRIIRLHRLERVGFHSICCGVTTRPSQALFRGAISCSATILL